MGLFTDMIKELDANTYKTYPPYVFNPLPATAAKEVGELVASPNTSTQALGLVVWQAVQTKGVQPIPFSRSIISRALTEQCSSRLYPAVYPKVVAVITNSGYFSYERNSKGNQAGMLYPNLDNPGLRSLLGLPPVVATAEGGRKFVPKGWRPEGQ